MRDAAKRSTAGPTVRQAIGLGRTLRGALACLLALVAFCGIGASSAFAQNPPAVTVTGSSEVGVTSARLEGEVNPEGEAGSPSTFFHFEVSADNGAGEPDGNWIFVNGNPDGEISGPEAEEANPVAVEGIAEGLAPNTTYFIRLAADNAEFANHAETSAPFPSFTTDEATEPVLATTVTDGVGFSSATLHGTVDPEGGNVNPIGGPLPINWELQYREAGVFGPGEGWTPAGGGEISGAEAGESNPVAVQAELPPGTLQAAKSYEVRLFAYYLGFSRSAESPEPFESFETEAATAPTVSVEDVSAPGITSAQFFGHVELADSDPAFNAECRFEYVTEADFADTEWAKAASKPCSPNPVEGAGDTAVSAEPTDLLPGTTYHLRLSASNQGGSDEAIAANTFTTEPAAPALGHTFVSDVGPSAATLNAEVDPSGAPTTVHFEYLTAASFEASGFASATSTPESASLGEDNTEHLAQARIEGLDADTRYAYRAIATNSVESVPGEAHFFHTEAIQSEEADSCPNAARRAEQHASFLPDCRAYEMVSPPQKFGSDILGNTIRARAAADGSAIEFLSYGAFADAVTVPYATEYIAERTAAPGGNGWASHSISPVQDPLTVVGAVFANGEPVYEGDLSADLSKGVFHAWSPLTEAPNVSGVPGPLYLRDNLRQSGAGGYRLISDANQPLAAHEGMDFNTRIAGTGDDFSHVIFESRRPLRANADRENVKLYENDGQSTVPRLLLAGPNCGFERNAGPCSAAGQSAFAKLYTERTISADGSRVELTDPVNPGQGFTVGTPGAVSRIFQHDDHGTSATADDALIELNASEAPSPGFTGPARFGTASTDGNRVFFFSPEDLTGAAPGGGLYMWQRSEEDETQSLAVDASGGSFTLTAHTQPTIGSGDVAEGSNELTSISAGSFMVGQTVSGPGIPAGTQVTAMKSGPNRLILSQPATETTAGATIEADVEATTPALPFNASAGEVQATLEALSTSPTAPEEARRLLGEGNVQVSGGAPSYEVEFTGALAGVDVRPLSADPSGLSGGASTATVSVADPVENLSLITQTSSGPEFAGTIGASEDGHRLYFATAGSQLVSGGPPVTNSGIYYWQDAEGAPGGTLSFVGQVFADDASASINFSPWNAAAKVARLTPDGRTLIFEASDGSGLAPRYDSSCTATSFGNPNNTFKGCSQIYLYRADTSTPTVPDLICASCDPDGEPPTDSAWMQWHAGAGATQTGTHLSHALSADGRYVFFATAAGLVPRDTNGVKDAYAYDTRTERVHLLSSGTSGFDSFFLDASTDGSDAFILTRERLSRWDFDGNYDVYDVRIDGGLPEPPPPGPAACEGETCRSAASPAPPPAAVASTHEGVGNPKPQRRCPRKQRLVRKRGKTRCVSKRHHRAHKHKRSARSHRRAGR